MKRFAEAAVPLKHHWDMAGLGRGKKQPLKQRALSGNRRVYLGNRITRDRPDVLECMKAGEFATVRQAARAAGILSVSGSTQGRPPVPSPQRRQPPCCMPRPGA